MQPAKIREALKASRDLPSVAAETGLSMETLRKFAAGWSTADVKVNLPLQSWLNRTNENKGTAP